MTVEVFAPAKINLTLHVTGQRDDGYHLLDSYVVFADVGDDLTVTLAEDMALTVSGPFAAGVPTDARNLCWRAAELFGVTAHIHLVKNLPPAAGIGGGSSDAAAVIKALEALTGRPAPFDPMLLGADVPVCMVGHAARMQGIGEYVLPLFQEPDFAVLVNPRVEVPTPQVFARLAQKANAPMTPWPEGGGKAAALAWLKAQRNDLQAPAIAVAPVIGEVLAALKGCEGARMTRMSGSGATCFAVFETLAAAEKAATRLAGERPDWWVRASILR